MSIILKQEPANSVPTPPFGKGTLFLNETNAFVVKGDDGNLLYFPTLGGANTQVLFNDTGSLAGTANFTYDSTTNTLTVTNGNVVATGVKTDNLYYANGNPWDLQQPAGSNNQLQFNNDGSFGASANLTYNDTTQLFTVSGNIDAVNVDAGNLLTANFVSGTLTTSSQPNITSVGTLSSLAVTGNVTAGNVYSNSGIIGAQTIKGEGGNISNIQGANVSGAVSYAITANSVAGANVSGEVAYAATANSVAGANVSGQVSNALVAGTVYTAAQPNITSVGTLTTLGVNGTVTAVAFTANTGVFTGNGSGLSAIAGANVTGTVANATYAISAGSATTAGTVTTASQPNITSVGTLSSLGVTGNISANNLSTTNKITAGNGLQVITGTLTVTSGNLDVTGNINVTGNLNYSNVTDLVVGDPLIYIGANNTGDLYDLGIVASYNDGTYEHTGLARNSSTDVWTFFDGVVQEPTTVIDWANATYPTVKLGNLIATGTANITGNANVGNIGATNGVFTNVSGNGSTLTALNASNISSGTLDQARLANSSLTVNGQSISLGGSGTITANTTQTLSNGSYITGDSFNGGTARTWAVDATSANTASKVVARDASGNFSAGTITATLSGSATTAGTVTTAAQPNITSVGALTSLAVTGNASAGNLSTGGTLSVTGNANVGNIGATNGVFTNVSGNGSALTAIAGANVTGTVANATYAVSAGTASTVTTAAQPNITSVGTLTSLDSIGNITANNIIANTFVVVGVGTGISAAGTVQGNATALVESINVVSTVATGAGVKLPTAVAGMRITVLNTSANALLVYPDTNGIINSAAANAAYSQPAGARLDYISTTTTQWYTLNATYG